jgi:hypothetical protein
LATISANPPFSIVVLCDVGRFDLATVTRLVGLLQAVRALKPAFVLNTEDMIDGNANEETTRE